MIYSCNDQHKKPVVDRKMRWKKLIWVRTDSVMSNRGTILDALNNVGLLNWNYSKPCSWLIDTRGIIARHPSTTTCCSSTDRKTSALVLMFRHPAEQQWSSVVHREDTLSGTDLRVFHSSRKHLRNSQYYLRMWIDLASMFVIAMSSRLLVVQRA